jgi:hypothetical protein
MQCYSGPMFRPLAILLLVFGCQGQVENPPEEGDPDGPDGGLGLVPVVDDSPDAGAGAMLTPGSTARVTASALNLRASAGTSAAILVAMPCGAEVDVLGGPSSTPDGWWNVRYQTNSGWASGKFLVPSSSFDPSVCTMSVAPDAGTVMTGNPTIDSIFALAQSAVGYSYYWGHGSWRADHATLGSCTGSCPSCTHAGGQYGADCSGFVAKVWQVPSASPIETDAHPYSTYNFYNEETHWKKVPRSSIQPADAFVRRENNAGHIALYESGTDPFGNVWLYEARGCATGVVHNLRTPDSSYITIRRDGL